MKYLALILLICCISCGNSQRENKTPSADTTGIVGVPACSTEEETLKKIAALPEVKEAQKQIDSISNHTHGVSYITHVDTIDHKYYYKIEVGYESSIRRENYFIFYVEKGDCNNIRVWEPVAGNIVPLEDWRKTQAVQAESGRQSSVSKAATETEIPVKLPFDFKGYYKTCVYPGNAQQCGVDYPSYPVNQNNTLQQILKQQINRDPEDYFKLPVVDNGIKAFLVTYKGDVEQYYLITISSNDQFISKMLVGQVEENALLYFSIDQNLLISLYKASNNEEKGTLQKQYKIDAAGRINVL
ncbi:hypothetical protein HHL17_10400 [Chitinophaga sp. G-6-1-13]|uniref:Uncharacterized protein n=1 Tax=Chitinophaga fulva TaxID=2728842 RepID=A0A848GIS7_9BACT|nr:hypothetical protein [Chitinophaga fulva]NML37601.1 hypothetical protein [Chitinophaga fulva]